MHTLVIDDSKAIRMILARMLRSMGMEVSQASNGLEAWEWLQSHDVPDLALVDWNMPEMDGITLLRKVKAESRYSPMRIAMVTTETETKQVQRAIEAGADEYVMKPFTPDVVIEKLRAMGMPV